MRIFFLIAFFSGIGTLALWMATGHRPDDWYLVVMLIYAYIGFFIRAIEE